MVGFSFYISEEIVKMRYNNSDVDRIKRRHPKGTRVELISMYDKQAPSAGTQGTVRTVDDMGTIHMKWDNGSSLGLVANEDRWKII